MFSSTKAFTLACIAAISNVALADQPVHCKYLPKASSNQKLTRIIYTGMKSQIAGYWTFEVSREAVKPDLNSSESICTHE